MILNCINSVCSCLLGGGSKGKALKSTVVLVRKNVLDFNDFNAAMADDVQELLGQTISLQLVSATVANPNNGNKGVVGAPAHLDNYIANLPSIVIGDSSYTATFQWEAEDGIPGAVIVKNRHSSQFLLKTITLEDFPGVGRIHFDCNSWIYPVNKYKYDRIFFANIPYLPKETPAPLKPYRDEELLHLRGEDVTGELQEWDRVYDYAYYNDLGDPDTSAALARPVLGGSAAYPYPRRGKTGRPPTKKDPNSESKPPLVMNRDVYVPRDERFGHLKMADFLTYTIKALAQAICPVLEAIFSTTPNEFNSFDDVLRLYEGGLPVPNVALIDQLREEVPFEMLKELLRTEQNQEFLKLPEPDVIKADKWAWRTDEEFAREMLAGVNPVIIKRLEVFPPVSNLDPDNYGNQNSTITAAQIEQNLDGLTVDQALSGDRLFILDHHDALMPYLNRINSTSNKVYATRTLLFLKEDSTLKLLAIELSLPHPSGEQNGAVSKVYTPVENGIDGSIWELAKAYVAVNDYGVHQLISHWLNTHATMEPFVIATNRQLSVLHPINKLLTPHYLDTMNINALGRQTLINAGGILETTVFPGKYSMELSSIIYKNWNFVQEALPADLIKRGVAVKDQDNKLNLLIKDYPYAVDGLEIWQAIHIWVTEYCSIYYPDDTVLQTDTELQAWWKEVREVGHGDKKDEAWWPEMQTVSELIDSCSTIIWVASALHAAINFSQYPYSGYIPNRPTLSRRFMPEEGTPEYEELKVHPDKVFLRTITSQLQTIIEVSLIEILSTHSTDEVYLGQRITKEWTADQKALQAFQRFGAAVTLIEADIIQKNGDPNQKNRNGPVKMPYTSLLPTSGPGITRKGIPNSVSI